MLFRRNLMDQARSWLFKGKVIIIFGARQVGKTTLCKSLMEEFPGAVYLLCERPVVKETLQSQNIERILWPV